MPLYQASCPKGHNFEQFQSYADYDEGKPLTCPAHGLVGNRLISKANIGGTSSFKLGVTSTITKELEHQLGVSGITSAKEVDRICKEKGLAMVDKEWQPSSSIIKNREAAGMKKAEDKLRKVLSQHSEVILPDGTRKSLGM